MIHVDAKMPRTFDNAVMLAASIREKDRTITQESIADFLSKQGFTSTIGGKLWAPSLFKGVMDQFPQMRTNAPYKHKSRTKRLKNDDDDAIIRRIALTLKLDVASWEKVEFIRGFLK